MPTAIPAPKTLYDKIWDNHVVSVQEDGLTLLYIDRHLVHEVCSPQAFDGLRLAGRSVRRPDCTLATVDHNIPTTTRKGFANIKEIVSEPESLAQCLALEENVKEFGLTFFGMNDRRQGIVHIIGPEQGFTLPGSTCVCGDSHTSTHGAFGCLAFGVGTSEVELVLATQTLLQKKSKNMRITVDGELHEGVTSKDVILHIIGTIGAAGGTGCVIEYAGSVFRNFSMESRMSVCNMSIEAGARAGMVAPDEVTFAYLKERPLAPKGEMWDRAVEYWRTLKSDEGAKFDVEVKIDAADIAPTVTWGTSPQDVAPITGTVPDPSKFVDPMRRATAQRSLKYMGLEPNTRMEDIKIDRVFIGSCTNSRIEDLRSAAKVVLAAGPEAKVASHVHAMIVPGSGIIKEQAEAEGLQHIFKRAGFDWREAGCSMCLGMNPDQLAPGERCASTSNRNFEGRQGAGGRTHLLSPAMAAAAALTGRLTDVRKLLGAKNEVPTSVIKILNSVEFSKADPYGAPKPQSGNLENSHSTTASSPVRPKFTVLKGVAARVDIENIDTDMIIPKQFLKTLKKTGLGSALFYTLRKDPKTGEETDFVLNRPPFNDSKILICTGNNFGCGSSREHAPWSLNDFGIRCIIAPSFGDIFRNNTLQNGMLAITLPKGICHELADEAETGGEFEVDLQMQVIRRPSGKSPISFEIDPFRRHCLLNGLDDISLILEKEKEISSYERNRSRAWPWLDGVGFEGNVTSVDRKPSQNQFDW